MKKASDSPKGLIQRISDLNRDLKRNFHLEKTWMLDLPVGIHDLGEEEGTVAYILGYFDHSDEGHFGGLMAVRASLCMDDSITGIDAWRIYEFPRPLVSAPYYVQLALAPLLPELVRRLEAQRAAAKVAASDAVSTCIKSFTAGVSAETNVEVNAEVKAEAGTEVVTKASAEVNETTKPYLSSIIAADSNPESTALLHQG